MVMRDEDDRLIVDYLGDGYREAVTKGQHQGLYRPARAFVLEQLDHHRAGRDTKLESRYAWLLRYFDSRRADG
jgi:hypothetical protein